MLNRVSTDTGRFAKAKFEPGFESKGLSTAPQRASSASRWHKMPETGARPTESLDHPGWTLGAVRQLALDLLEEGI